MLAYDVAHGRVGCVLIIGQRDSDTQALLPIFPPDATRSPNPALMTGRIRSPPREIVGPAGHNYNSPKLVFVGRVFSPFGFSASGFFMKRGALYVLALSGCVCWSSASQADVFVLTTGGQVRGELLNKDESPRKTYQIKTPTGGMLAVESDQVKEVVRQTEAEIKYDQIRSRFADTVAGQ